MTLVAPTSIRWDTLNYHRAHATYRLPLGVCELIVRGLLPSQDFGTSKLTSWVSDDAMNALYERLLREYYTAHHPEHSAGAPTVDWDMDEPSGNSLQLPLMRTDVTLRNRGRTLIINAKYTAIRCRPEQGAMGGPFDESLPSLFICEERGHPPRRLRHGLLLYARTDAEEQPELDVVIQGNRIGARTLDLNGPWECVSAQLEDIAGWLGV